MCVISQFGMNDSFFDMNQIDFIILFRILLFQSICLLHAFQMLSFWCQAYFLIHIYNTYLIILNNLINLIVNIVIPLKQEKIKVNVNTSN